MTIAYKDTDKATDHLLDFIAGGVPTNKYGESTGNYNAVFGDIDASDPLSAKTLTQIYQMQDAMLKQNGISTATGRYQGLKGTIQEYQKRKALPNGTKFTELLQDDFGLLKMVDRGYSAWWQADIGDDEFMHRLSCEWASLPDPKNGGKSHYDGDSAGNHASTTLEHFRAAVRQARAYIGSEAIPTPPPLPPAMTKTQAEGHLKSVQIVLARAGVYDGTIDGLFGRGSTAALNTLLATAGQPQLMRPT